MPRLSEHICPRLQTAMDILGRRWTGLIIGVLTEGPLRFSELATHLQVISERELSERLKELVKDGIVERRVIPESPVQVEYRLTDKGAALEDVLTAVGAWADAWIEAPGKSRRSKR